MLFLYIYKNLLKPLLFLFDPEKVHENMTSFGELLGKIKPLNKIINKIYGKKSKFLKLQIAGMEFESPIGLAAGFDYDAKLSQILPSLGFGFQTVGTLTNFPYQGNPSPMLGRLPKSKSLMVNKGFKNKGAQKISGKLEKLEFAIPLGISIGKSNTLEIKTQIQAIEDITKAFEIFEKLKIKNSYYELNISCPNLFGNISFYPSKNLDQLLSNIDKIQLKKPLFIKMPIEKNDKETLAMLEVIMKHRVTGVILGNLQKDRKKLHPSEENKFKVGNFSGKPTEKRSNELINLAYKKYGKKLVIIGCGGVFSAEDAYKKIKLGASLVQLITGLIYEGPTLVSEINKKLPRLLAKDGFKNISEAVGTEVI